MQYVDAPHVDAPLLGDLPGRDSAPPVAQNVAVQAGSISPAN